jgi:UDP-glucuronate 4-epimerase
MATLSGEKILLTGPTSQVAFPIARALARDNDVLGLARFSNAGDVERVEAVGVQPIRCDLASGNFDGIPDDVTIVLNFAVVKSGDFEYDLAANGEGVGLLMSHCRNARAFVHCSSAAVYEASGHEARPETHPLGDNHRFMFPTYSISKIAAETMVRFGARQWNLPSVIARLAVPYGDNGGWPWYHLMMMKNDVPITIHSDGPNTFNLLHEDDYVAQIPALVAAASVPAMTVNWAGDRASIEEWTQHLASLTGLEPRLVTTPDTIPAVELDCTRMHDLLGETHVRWKDGIRRMVAARNPELLKG